MKLDFYMAIAFRNGVNYKNANAVDLERWCSRGRNVFIRTMIIKANLGTTPVREGTKVPGAVVRDARRTSIESSANKFPQMFKQFALCAPWVHHSFVELGLGNAKDHAKSKTYDVSPEKIISELHKWAPG